MTSQQLLDTQHTPTPQLDAHLKGIREEFERLTQELHEARKQRDEYQTNYSSQAKELQELQQIVFHRKDRIICQHCNGEIVYACGGADNSSPIISPASSTSEYHSAWEGEDAADDRLESIRNAKAIASRLQKDQADVPNADIVNRNEIREDPGIASLMLESDVTCTDESEDSDWDSTSGTSTALKLNLLHRLTQEGTIITAFSMDGKHLATVSSIGIVCIFDVQTGKRISVMSDLYEKPEERASYICLSFSPDSKYLATGGKDGKIRIWIISRKRVKTIFRNDAIINDLHFSPDGKSIVATSWQRTVTIWRLRDGFSRVLTGARSAPWAVRFSTDGRYVLSGTFSGHMLIWNVREGKLVGRMRIHESGVNSLRLTPDGKGLLTVSLDKTVIHWDISSLGSLGMAQDAAAPVENDPTTISNVMEISRLVGHTDKVYAVSISADGKWIVSGSWDHTVRIWNAHDATLQCSLNHRAEIWSVDFSPIGNYLAIGDQKGKVTIWNYAESQGSIRC